MTETRGRLRPWMRWLLVLPAAFGADLFAQWFPSPSGLVRIWEVIRNHTSPLSPLVDAVTWQVWAPAWFVWAGAKVAPSRRARVSICLAAFKVLVASYNILTRIQYVKHGGSWWRLEDIPEVPVWWFAGASALGILVVTIVSARFVLKESPVGGGEIGSRLIIQALPRGVRLLLSYLGFPPFLWLVMVLNLSWLHSGRMNTVLLLLPWASSFALSLWIPQILTRFEAVVLMPLGITSTLLAMTYFFQRAWWVGAWFVVLWLLVGGFGASLHPEMTIGQLAVGTISYPINFDASFLKISPRQAAQLGMVTLKISFASGVSVALLAYHNGQGALFAMVLGLASVVAGPVTAFLYAVLTAAPLMLVSGRTSPQAPEV